MDHINNDIRNHGLLDLLTLLLVHVVFFLVLTFSVRCLVYNFDEAGVVKHVAHPHISDTLCMSNK